jgi:hypothetical protein
MSRKATNPDHSYRRDRGDRRVLLEEELTAESVSQDYDTV